MNIDNEVMCVRALLVEGDVISLSPFYKANLLKTYSNGGNSALNNWCPSHIVSRIIKAEFSSRVNVTCFPSSIAAICNYAMPQLRKVGKF